MFNHLNLITPIEITAKDGPRGRFYTTPEGNKYPSITTVLGAGEKEWLTEWRLSMGIEKADKETKRAAERGTAVHAMVEEYLNNNPDPTQQYPGSDAVLVFNKMRFILNKIDNIITQETALWSDEMKVAGRVDCVGDYKGKLSLIDFKTSTGNKRESMIGDYYLQTTAYALMFQERYGIQIDNLVIIMGVEKDMPLVFQQPVEPYIEPLLRRINTYYTTYGAKQ